MLLYFGQGAHFIWILGLATELELLYIHLLENCLEHGKHVELERLCRFMLKDHLLQVSGRCSSKLWRHCTMQMEVSNDSGLLMPLKLAVYPVFLPR